MTSLRGELCAQLRNFDEDAFVALANRGLLRRALKDLEKSPAELGAATADGLEVRVGEHRVQFDRRGVVHARCSCPATSICQHVLAAALALQRLPASDAAPAANAPTLHEQLMALDGEALRQHAGKPGVRWATEFALDQDLARDVQFAIGKAITITFARPRLVAHYTGGGLDGVVLDTRLANEAKYQVAAVLVYQRAHGATLAMPAAPGQAQHLELGDDFTPATATATEQTESRRRLRQATRQLAGECVAIGLAHVSDHVQQRFATLAVWARGADYHRLARQLGRLADHVDLLLQRAGGADAHRLLDELTLAYGLVAALEHAAAEDRAPTALVGRARSRYEDSATLTLLGLGASAFRSGTGYAGLTMLFHSPVDGTFLSCTDARPASLRSFDPVARYRQPGPWSGLNAPQAATGRLVTLTNARTNEQGRIAAAERVVATVQPAVEPFAALPAVTKWARLADVVDGTEQGLLAEAQPMRRWVILAPARFEPARFDATRQTLVWPLVDDEGATLRAELVWSETSRHAIERVESLQPDDVPAGTRVVARVSLQGGERVVEPLSLVRAGAPETTPVDCLHFDAPAAKTRRDTRRTTAAAAEHPEHAHAPTLPPPLAALRAWLRRTAERGLAADSANAHRRDLIAHLDAARRQGLTTWPAAPDGIADVGELLLRTNYLAMQYERLLHAPGDFASWM